MAGDPASAAAMLEKARKRFGQLPAEVETSAEFSHVVQRILEEVDPLTGRVEKMIAGVPASGDWETAVYEYHLLQSEVFTYMAEGAERTDAKTTHLYARAAEHLAEVVRIGESSGYPDFIVAQHREELQRARGKAEGDTPWRRSSSMCFIATACCGDREHPDVVALRRFRDEVLAAHTLGRGAIWTYERVSPPIARALERSPRLRSAVREVIVRPLAERVRFARSGLSESC